MISRAVRSNRERGAVAVLVAVMIVILIGFAALVIDMGRMYRTRAELQTAADSAALAGAQHLDRTPEGIARARVAVHQYAGQNRALGDDVAIADGDIQFGHWDLENETFTPLPDTGSASAINAVRVVDRRTEGSGNPVPLFFARLLGRSTADVDAAAIAIAGGPMSECGFPMVVPDCSLDEPIAAGTCDYCMVYQDNNNDNAGWTTFDQGAIGGPAIADIIEAACFASDGSVLVDPVTRECTGMCVTTTAGDEIKVQNGNLMNNGASNFCPLIQQILTRGVDGGPAYPFVVRVPVLESSSSTCDAAQFSSYKTVAGYAALEIFGAKCSNPDPGVMAPASPCTPPSSGKHIVAALRCDLESDDGVAGGGYFGVDAVHVRLAR
jgi:hypothetical protein